nr:glycine-rich cell wall structural protein 1.8 [Ipomoea batatas]
MEGKTASSHSTSTQHRATMDGYRKVEKQKLKSPLSENEIRVASHGLVRNYFYYATTLLQERRTKDIVLKALGRAITKTVIIAELIKKRFPGLHQDTAISSVSITDVWEPIDEVGLETVEKTYHVSMISITLSEKELNKNSPGYQAPSHAEQGQQYNNNYLSQQPYRQSHEVYSSDNEDSCGQGNGCGRGKGCGLNIGGYGNYQGNHPGNCKVICYVSADEEEGSGETKVDTGYSRGGRSEDDDSDDCVILEEDPDKPVKVVNEKVDNDSDDLLVVSEKGQVACRDYPHPRHLCVKFPFATTPHESHCDKLVWSMLCSPGVAVLVAFKLSVQGESNPKLVQSTLCSPGVVILVAIQAFGSGSVQFQACSVHVEFTQLSVGIDGVQASIAGGMSNPKLGRSMSSSHNYP